MAGDDRRVFEFGPFVLDPAEHLLLKNGQVVPLTPKAFETLVALVEQAGRLVQKDALLKRVWPDVFVEEVTLAQNVSTIRKALGRHPDGREYIETVPRLGYRFSATVRDIRPASAADGAPTAVPATRRHHRVRAVLAVAATVLAAVAALTLAGTRARKAESAASPITLAILPFKNLQPDPAWDFLGFSLADAIISRLTYVPQVIVRPASYVEKYRGTVVDPRAAARDLGVTTVLAGSFLKEGDSLRIAAELVDVGRNEILWHERLDLRYDRLMAVQDLVARRIVDGLDVKLTPEELRRLGSGAPRNPAAYELALKGSNLNAKGEWNRAIALLERSVSLDPAHAEAWSHLGLAYYGHGAFQSGGAVYVDKALAAYRRALELNPSLPAARVWMATYFTGTGRVEEAVTLLREVTGISPNYGEVYWQLGLAYGYAGLLEESLETMERGRALDPEGLSLGVASHTYLYSGEYEKFLSMLGEDGSARTAFYLGLAHYYLTDRVRARAEFDRAYELDPSLIHARIGKAIRHAMAGEDAEGLEELARIERLDRPADGELLYMLAQASALLGRRDAALRLLARAIEQDFFCYPYLVRDELFASLRGDATFTQLLDAARTRRDEFRRAFFP